MKYRSLLFLSFFISSAYPMCTEKKKNNCCTTLALSADILCAMPSAIFYSTAEYGMKAMLFSLDCAQKLVSTPEHSAKQKSE